MNIRKLLIQIFVVFIVFGSFVKAETVEGFQWPFSPYEDYKRDQFSMEYNTGFTKYHFI